MDRCIYGNDLELKRKLLIKKEDEATKTIYEIDNIIDRMDIRFKSDKDDIAIVSKENLLVKPFQGKPSPEYPAPWLTVTYGEFGDLIKACAYVLKKKYDLAPNSRVGIIANFTPLNHLLLYALWYNRCAIVQIPTKLGNEVKQFWCRLLNLKMIFYDINFEPFDTEEDINMMKENDEWVWKWQLPLTENEKNLDAGQEGILAVNLFSETFRNEILEAKNQGKKFQRKGYEEDVIYIIGTSSSSQAIIKNGQCSEMKFVPMTTYQSGESYNYSILKDLKIKPTFMINIPVSHTLGYYSCVLHNIQFGGAVVYHTQQLRDVGFIPEIILDDMVETNVDHTLLFPFHFSLIKKLFDENHPHCEKWKKFISSRSNCFFKTGGAPMSDEIDNWLFETFGIRSFQDYGSSEAGSIMNSDFSKPALPGEETYLSKRPWADIYLKPIDDDPNIGELHVRSPTNTTGYIRKAEIGEFYESSMPSMRTDIGAESLFTYINGEKFLKINDIWRRSPKSGKYKYISRIDDVIVFSTGLKMNPIPFESTVTKECNNIKYCCLILDSSKSEVVCFVEPEWKKIIMENGQLVDTSIDSSTLNKDEIGKLGKAAQKQIWNSLYSVLMDDSKSLTSWAKQLTINNIFVIEYGKQLPRTEKGSISRRITKVEYENVLQKISKLISGEIKTLENFDSDDEVTEIISREINSDNNDDDESETFDVENISDYNSEYDEESDEEDETRVESANSEENQIGEKINEAIRIIHESIKEIIPSTPDFLEFNAEAPFTIYGIESLATIKLANILSRKFNKRYSPAILFNYGTTMLLAKHITGYENTSYSSQLLDKIPKELDNKSSNKIAIIGMALRLPGAINNSKSLWMALAKGKDCVLPPVKTRDLHTRYANKSADQLELDEHYLPRIGCYDTRNSVAKPSEFDASFFNCLPDEAVALDPRHRWILETSWEALENAGIAPNSLKKTTTGVFIGINNEHEHEDLLHDCGIIPPLASHATAQSSIAGRLSYFYQLFGPSYTIDTACSTGSSALHSACQSLQCNDCNLSIVTGVKYMYSSKEFHKTCSARMTSPNGRCATFDASADGFAQSEGCVTFILKRFDDAVRDNDNILAVVLGSASGQSGLRQSISAPSSEGQTVSIKRAMEKAGITPEQVSFVEAHGTGTPLGDALEVHALNQVYGGSHTEENPLIVGSIKSNIGHTCEAAGLASIAKVIVAMKYNLIPRNIHFNELNPEIDLSTIPMKIPTKTLPWNPPNDDTPLIAQVSSFGLQGSIIVTFLEQYVPEKKIALPKKEQHILTISAKTYPALLDLYDNYCSILENMDDDEDISNLCYTSNIGREHFAYRLVATGTNPLTLYNSLEEEMEKLEKKHDSEESEENDSSDNKKAHGPHIYLYAEDNNKIISEDVFKCVSELYNSQPVFRKVIKNCDKEIMEITHQQYSLVKDIASLGKEEKKDMPYINNIITLAIHHAYYKLMKSVYSVDNSLFIGYGYGELSAILNAGGISFKAASQLLKLLILPKAGVIFRSIKKWYKVVNKNFKLNSNTFTLSNHHEYKIGKSIPLNYWISMVKVLLNNDRLKEKYISKGNNYIIKTFGETMKEMNIFSIKPELCCMIDGSMTGVSDKLQIQNMSQINILSFNVSDIEECKKAFVDFIIENYKSGKEINWTEFHKRQDQETRKPYSLQKIELPTYPFQRFTFWPKPKN
ncbi:hypothetical protein BCR36DRAFT_315942 [Piromyces finnis]|uniref:Ketosynthase family 3 (KS3) domain-containing protein n=1 Tax=Piromyces finnis TaxID=1754191 RepID=A0A1Y1VNB8_9FUNG|nr:hypothetical protein BCR36DRAFT_315942 [Piromyces finnis]|eukprot:ORX59870.1 hypothetical protein BCR36DRAFT_315942 [Piromyces finnis]